MDPITITVIGFQIGVSIYNQYKNRAVTEKIKAEQREAKKNELLNNQRRDIERFQRSCQLQEQMEWDSHMHKIQAIKQDFLNSFEKMIHKENLETSYRLSISPYIIQRSVIPMSVENLEDTRHELFCILTGSNDLNFNRDALPYLDDAISDSLSKYWNESSNHTICYYQNIWDTSCTPFSNEDIENLKTLIPTPTMTLTPFFTKEENGYKLSIKLNVWGIENSQAIAADIPTEAKFGSLPNKYTLQDIDEIIEKVVPSAICLIGQIADVFYWTNFYLPPLLPYLLGKDLISVPEYVQEQYIMIYSTLYSKLAIGIGGSIYESSEALQVANDIIEINQYNHPERSLSFLKNFMIMAHGSSLSSEVLRNSMISLYRAKTDRDARTLDDIDASLISNADFAFVSQHIELAKICRDYSLVRDLTHIVKRKIMSWR